MLTLSVQVASVLSRSARIGALTLAGAVVGCGGDGGATSPQPPQAALLKCDDSMKSAFKPDAQTTVTLVKQFRKGDTTFPSNWGPGMQVSEDVCLVKLMVGPGNPGPTSAPSTTAGIGMEVWLPNVTAWNGRVHNLGNGGWGGTSESVLTKNSELSAGAIGVATLEGAVSSTTDMGYLSPVTFFKGDQMMNPDGTINKALWADFSSRHLVEQALKTRALATAFYGTAPTRNYFEGASTGGRQALKLAQEHPELYDGIAASFPAINWTRLFASVAWRPLVVQRDLGGVDLTVDQLSLVSNAAIGACDVVGGQHLGYILDPSACQYDPTTDSSVLCAANGGANATSACVTPVQAAAINKFWYGVTSDGSVPAPALDVGWEVPSPSGVHRWYGLARGTSMSPPPPPIFYTSQIALSLQDPTLASPDFLNATGNGADYWKLLTYAQFSNLIDRGYALQESFAHINTDNPDLSAFKAKGGKMVMMHGLNDAAIPAQGSINYYNRVASKMNGIAAIQDFYRFYLIPGFGHGFANGTTNPSANPPTPGGRQIYDLVVDWVEKGTAPADRLELTPSAQGGPTAPACAYPKKRTYVSGDVNLSASYSCS